MRGEYLKALKDMGVKVENITTRLLLASTNCMYFGTLTNMADNSTLQICSANGYSLFGKTATFMPKPVKGDNGSACTVTNQFGKVLQCLGKEYSGLPKTALYYIGGILNTLKQ